MVVVAVVDVGDVEGDVEGDVGRRRRRRLSSSRLCALAQTFDIALGSFFPLF